MEASKHKTFEAFVSGFLTLAPLYIIQIVAPPESLQGGNGDILLIPWALLIISGIAGFGYLRNIPTSNLLLGSLIGMMVSYTVFSLAVGWSYVMFFMIAITALPVIFGAGISYWLNQKRSLQD